MAGGWMRKRVYAVECFNDALRRYEFRKAVGPVRAGSKLLILRGGSVAAVSKGTVTPGYHLVANEAAHVQSFTKWLKGREVGGRTFWVNADIGREEYMGVSPSAPLPTVMMAMDRAFYLDSVQVMGGHSERLRHQIFQAQRVHPEFKRTRG